MKISILCSSPAHPVNAWLAGWRDKWRNRHDIELVRRKTELTGGDLLFLVSCGEILDAEECARYRRALVLHAGDLPRDRGWNPHIWAILEGAEQITVNLLEAADEPDTGAIWARKRVSIPRHALYDEINERLFDAETALMDEALELVDRAEPTPQRDDIEATYRRRRRPADSKLDPDQTIAEQFDRMRVADPRRYPNFFRLRGRVYRLTLEKISDDSEH